MSNGTLVNGQIMTLTDEIVKVKEQSQQKFGEMRDFYDQELIKMRKEFEMRESNLKMNMDSRIQDTVHQERKKITDQMIKLKQEKELLEAKLTKSS